MIDSHGIRQMIDEHGFTWEVWEAHPRLAERRALRERRTVHRTGTDRRIASHDERPMTNESGWLVFKSAREERRRTPIPAGWEEMMNEQLTRILRQSRATGPHPRHPL